MAQYNEALRQAQERMPRPWDAPGAKEREREMHDFITEQNKLETLRRRGEAGLPGGIDPARYQELMDKLQELHKERLAQIEDTTSVATARIAQLWVDMANTMENSFGTLFMDVYHEQLKTMGDYFNQLAEGIAAAWSRALSNMIVEWMQAQARMAASGIGKFIGGALGMGGGSSITQGEFDVLWSAKGNVFDSPRVFRFAQGVGVLGEEGPEGVLPLKRTASGDLGVQVAGGAGGAERNVSVQIINESGSKMRVTKSTAKVDVKGMVITAWMDGYTNDSYGLRTFMGG
jgi:phage-related minor tail protein